MYIQLVQKPTRVRQLIHSTLGTLAAVDEGKRLRSLTQSQKMRPYLTHAQCWVASSSKPTWEGLAMAWPPPHPPQPTAWIILIRPTEREKSPFFRLSEICHTGLDIGNDSHLLLYWSSKRLVVGIKPVVFNTGGPVCYVSNQTNLASNFKIL